MMMSEENKAESATDKLRSLLRNIENIADRALGTQPYDEVPCWEHLSSAVGEIEKELALVSAGSGAFFTNENVLKEVAEQVKPCETPLDPNAPEMVRGGEPDEKKAIGNICKPGKCISYAIDKRFCVMVTAAQEGREDEWSFDGVKDGVTVIHGTILAGRWGANHYCKFIRNGIVSRANRIIKNRAHRKAKAKSLELGAESFVQRPAPLTPEEENGGSDGAQPSQGEGAAA